MALKRRVANSRLALIAGFLLRLKAVARHNSRQLARSLGWLVRSREHTNFTYELTPRNRSHLAWFLSEVARVPSATIDVYLDEIVADTELRRHVERLSEAHPRRYLADRSASLGRRIGWYALVRAAKPKVVVETGTDKGLGSIVMAAALRRNSVEGKPGRLITVDVNPDSGYLIQDPYAEFCEHIVGDSLEYLRDHAGQIDLFLHDSDHSGEHEAAEYDAVAPNLSGGAFVVSDNAHATDRLAAFARATDRAFLFFDERPADHWYPGAGIGIAWRHQG